jgi:ribosome-associated protein
MDEELTDQPARAKPRKEIAPVQPEDLAPAKTPRVRKRAAAKPKDVSGLPSRDAAAESAVPEAPSPSSEAESRAQKQALELARRVVELAEDKKASDIVLLELRELTTLTDYFVIASGGSERQLQSIADGIVEGIKHDDGTLPIGREGGSSAHWLLLDYGSVIVHVMAQPERDFYGLEKLWSEAPLLLRVL